MKRHALLVSALLAGALVSGTCQAGSDGRQRTFGFAGEGNSYNRSGGTLVVEDLVFHISESTLVHRSRGGRGTLSDIAPGSKIGFYPGSGAGSTLSEVWLLPKSWKGQPGFADSPDR